MQDAKHKTRDTKHKIRKYWPLICLAAVFVIFCLLLLYRPSRYNPPDVVYSRQVSPYLTHELLPQLYNGAQLGEPFDLVVTQDGVNDIVARSKWPKEFGDITFSAPAVLFVPDSIVLMETANVKGAEFVVTVAAEPVLDHHGLLNLKMAEVRVGAVNITLFIKAMAKRIYAQRLAAADIDPNDLQAQIAASLLADVPFEPVLKIEDKRVRVKKITIVQGKLTAHLAPVLE